MRHQNDNSIGARGPVRKGSRRPLVGGLPPTTTRKPVTRPPRTMWCPTCGHKVGGKVEPCHCEVQA